jgi:hypothetical protein
MTMPLSECNEGSTLMLQQWSAQLSLNMQFFIHENIVLKFLNFCRVETSTVMKKKTVL